MFTIDHSVSTTFQGHSTQKHQFNLGNMLPQSNSKILVVIDSAVENHEILRNGIITDAEVITLNPQQNGVQQITQALQTLGNISSLHILSHGSPGSLQLGNSYLSLDTLKQYQKSLQNWSFEQLLLYGCNVAAGDAGTELIEKLHHLTGAEIAASTNLTGNTALGGDWNLDIKTSDFKVALAVTPEVQASYSSVLAEPIVKYILSVGNEQTETQTLSGIEYTFSSGDQNIIIINTFGIDDDNGAKDFAVESSLSNFAIQRVDNDQVTGEKQLVWFDQDNDNQTENILTGPFPDVGNSTEIMDRVLFQLSINAGTDNVFANANTDNPNNIERVDYFLIHRFQFQF